MPALAQNRKDQIHHVAKNMFREKGYAATSMRDLANGVGIEAASLYSHIKSKEEILQLICFQMAEEFLAAAEEIQKLNLPSNKQLARAIEAHIEIITRNTDAAAVFIHDWRHLSEPFLSDFKLMRKRYEDYFKKIISKGIKEEAFRMKDEKLTLFTIFTALNGLYEWYNPKGKLTPKEIAANMTDVFLNGILK